MKFVLQWKTSARCWQVLFISRTGDSCNSELGATGRSKIAKEEASALRRSLHVSAQRRCVLGVTRSLRLSEEEKSKCWWPPFVSWMDSGWPKYFNRFFVFIPWISMSFSFILQLLLLEKGKSKNLQCVRKGTSFLVCDGKRNFLIEF